MRLTRRTAISHSRSKMSKLLGGDWRFGAALIVALGLSACQLGGGKLGGAAPGASDVAAPSALQGAPVEVTTLAAPGATQPVPAQPVAPEAGKAEAGKAEPAKPETPPPPVVPEVVKSASQLACEKRGGRLVRLAKSNATTCQLPTRDGGKQCRRESDCDGVCLARSQTCAPVKPLLGCQAILQDDGRWVELCID